VYGNTFADMLGGCLANSTHEDILGDDLMLLSFHVVCASV